MCLSCSSWPSVTGIIYIIMHLIFSVDIIISFRVAYTDREALITDSGAVARNYCRCVHTPLLSDFEATATLAYGMQVRHD